MEAQYNKFYKLLLDFKNGDKCENCQTLTKPQFNKKYVHVFSIIFESSQRIILLKGGT